MPRQKKDAKVLNIKMDSSIYNQLNKFVLETGLTKTVATEKILQQFFEEYFRKNKKDRTII